ncbi:hypothetical protein F511_28505 [Dorcoceras hygrometricum]|uniref:Uncharacterized protein n=1 Tax=Dorcoceras hygrometricum TaxID=472368 RepID=A0A2Z7DDF4_9LAMI|nr:hypothetical protein F511_28505 [Dorcoceras hygrometricum]
MGPISNIGPKTSRAARDRPEQNPRRNQPSRHRRSIAGRRPPPRKSHGGSRITSRQARRPATRPAGERRPVVAPASGATVRKTAHNNRPSRAAEPNIVQPLARDRGQRPASGSLSRGNRHFTVGGGRLRQSGPRPEGRLLGQPALEVLTRSAWTDSPHQVGRNKFRRSKAAAAAAAFERGEGAALLMLGLGFFVSNSIGYPRMSASGESSTTMHRLLHASGSHPIPLPYEPKTNQYNQDLGLIHSTNGNHLESPNEGSSIDHQVTIYLHAQNITMFPTNETWYFASQILVSSSGGLILILTAQSARN